MCTLCWAQGIYRISAVKSKVDKLAEDLEERDVSEWPAILADQQPHTVANLVKHYLRSVCPPSTYALSPHAHAPLVLIRFRCVVVRFA